MFVPLALLADHATAHHLDGKLYITGGGIKTLSFALFPAVQPRLALALGIEVAPSELGVEHSLRIDALGPKSAPIFRTVSASFTVPRISDPKKSGYFHFVSSMDNVAFPEAGDYAIVVTIDGRPLERVEFSAEQAGDAQRVVDANATLEANSLVREGYEAYNRGDVAGAEARFRSAVEKFPHVADGHNNLGFVLLGKGDASGAVVAFERAKELHYRQSEINDANLATAKYLSGDPGGALTLFQVCLGSRFFSTAATLFGIGPNGLFSLQVRSASAYAALMALNAAWCAHALDDAETQAEFLTAARLGEMARFDEADALRFAESVAALEAAKG